MFPYHYPTDHRSLFDNFGKFLRDVEKAANDEAQAALFYTQLMDMAEKEFDKEQIKHARDDERKHLCQLRRLYYSLTGRYPAVEEPVPTETTYKAGLRKAFQDELEAAEFYRAMLLATRDMHIRDLLFEIMIDEMEHADRFSFIYPK
ncbi:hypothetical protein Tfer_1284 [Thermincola ferriacetica]|uniref:Rubrerythrin n=2 Tax=Thermincola TaxID=278993 RepID=D5XBL0_THEPJ|nr:MULTISPECIES: ferritin-like domain-containing protein [Thermincola]ADG83439.1 conserved hypothetical protein [Thermincola potens JR]KNZ69904.1 hypothetical protein Tfer_1284 [Thermincola ferriacetica]